MIDWLVKSLRSADIFEEDKLTGNFVIHSLWKDLQYGQTFAVHSDVATKSWSTRTWPHLRNVLQMQHCHTYKVVWSCKAVVFGTNMKLIRVKVIFIA